MNLPRDVNSPQEDQAPRAPKPNPYWRQVAGLDEDEIREAFITGYKSGQPYEPHHYTLFSVHAKQYDILDFGCGIGRNFTSLKRYAATLSGFDLPEMINACRNFHDTDNVQLLSSWREVRSKRFDIVVANLVLQHMNPADELSFYICELSHLTHYLYLSTRAWCDDDAHSRVLAELLDSGEFEYLVGSLSKADALSIEYPSEVLSNCVRQRNQTSPIIIRLRLHSNL